MSATKITTKITDLVEKDTTTECNVRVPTSNTFYITQPTDDKVMLGYMHQRIYFGGKSKKWVYENIDCLTDTTFSKIKAATDEKISMRGGWKTYYFQDPSGQMVGNAIVAELKSKASEYTTEQEQAPSPVAIYYDIQCVENPLNGSILCPSGTLKSNVIVRYDICAERLNVALLGTSDFTYYSFAIGEIPEARQLTFADAVYSAEYTIPVLHADAFSPDGNLLLCVDESADDDETYCKVIAVNKADAGVPTHKFATFGKMFGNNIIKWYPGRIQVKCYTGDLEFNLITGESKFIEFGVQNVNLVFKKWKTSSYAPYDSCAPSKINGLTWRVPSTKRARPLKTFVFEDEIVEHNYDFHWNVLNKSIPASNRSLEWIMLFENDNVAIFKIGCRTIICFDKLLQFQPVIYQIPKKDGLEIVAITRSHIYSQTYMDDEDEYGGDGGTITVRTYKFNFVSRLESQLRFNSIPNPPKGCAFAIVGKFLEHQKKD
jgi:hypothetical protein